MAQEAIVNCRNYGHGAYAEYFIRHPTMIGGPGHVVEIDKSTFTCRKYNVGHVVLTQWVLGGIDPATQECFWFPWRRIIQRHCCQSCSNMYYYNCCLDYIYFNQLNLNRIFGISHCILIEQVPSNLYIDPVMIIIGPSTNVIDLDVSMSNNCTFVFHISKLYKRCSNLAGLILRTFTMRDPQVMLTLYKSLVMSRLDYASQLWSPYLLKHVYLFDRVQRAFTKHITGMRYLSYSKRLEVLKLFSLQRRERDLYIIN